MTFGEKEVEKLAEKYHLRYRLFGDAIAISTPMSEWLVEHNGDNVRVKHAHRLGVGLSKYHVQRYFTKLEHAFDSISQHDYVKYTKKNIKEIKLA